MPSACHHLISNQKMETASFIGRREETSSIRTRYPGQVPIIIKIRSGSGFPASFQGAKFLVKADFLMSDFLTVVRHKLSLPKDRALVMFAADREMVTGEQRLGEVHQKYAHRDGFLYFWCYDQSALG